MNESLSSSEVPLPSNAYGQPNPLAGPSAIPQPAGVEPAAQAQPGQPSDQLGQQPQVLEQQPMQPAQFEPQFFQVPAQQVTPMFQPVPVQGAPATAAQPADVAACAAVPDVQVQPAMTGTLEQTIPQDQDLPAQAFEPPAFMANPGAYEPRVDSTDDDFAEEMLEEEEELDSYSFMQNRELSWLTFNERVLDQGADESVPLLERLNFISIFWSNLQEFFMVRVGSLTDLALIEPPVKDSKTGMTPDEQIAAIHERCRELYPIQESYYEHVRGSLAKEGVRHLRPDDLSDEQRNYLSGFVKFNIEPFLSPQIINPRHPFPHLENGKLYILVRLYDEVEDEVEKADKKKKKKAKKKDKGGAEGVVLGLIPLPHQCERIIKLPGRGFQFILLEHAIEMFVTEIFSMYAIKHTNVICVTRNADIDANQTGDEQDEDYREHMKRLLKQRARLAPVRLECERPLSPVMEKLMLKRLGLKREQVYDTIVPLDLSFTWGLGSRLSDKKREKLSNPSFTPAWPAAFDRKRRIIDQVGEKEVLLSYPYESMDPFVQLLKEAANDPTVMSIKITLYRLASQSQLAEALIAAAENGKEVTALFELRARFDESNNIEWSQRFEHAGCNVIYGFRDYKVHSKICCITRRMPDGSIQHITQLGTGNYNEKTAKLYTDLSFITTDEAFGRDAVEFFRNMQLENISDNYNVLRVAPLQIKPMILDNLDKQIALAREGKPCGAFLKANSVTDKDVIEKIAEASQAGVNVTLFVRGICCIVPKVKGATENVSVVSIVGRLLEHSRIYCFGTPDDCTMYLSSADLMTRNLNKRVEIAWPIQNPEIRARILEYVNICLHDTAKLRELRPNKTYTPLGAFCEIDEEGNSQPAFDAQNALIERAQQRARARIEAENAERASQQATQQAAQPASYGQFPGPQPEAQQQPAAQIQGQPAAQAQVQPIAQVLAQPSTQVQGQPYPQPHDGVQAPFAQFGGQQGFDMQAAARQAPLESEPSQLTELTIADFLDINQAAAPFTPQTADEQAQLNAFDGSQQVLGAHMPGETPRPLPADAAYAIAAAADDASDQPIRISLGNDADDAPLRIAIGEMPAYSVQQAIADPQAAAALGPDAASSGVPATAAQQMQFGQASKLPYADQPNQMGAQAQPGPFGQQAPAFQPTQQAQFAQPAQQAQFAQPAQVIQFDQAAQIGQQATPAQADAPTQPQPGQAGETPGFFDEAHRELEMPPAKGGLFARFRKKK